MVTQEIIDIGKTPNNRSGDPIRVAFAKINNNFLSIQPYVKTNLDYINIEIAVDADPSEILKLAFLTVNNNFSKLQEYIKNIQQVSVSEDTIRNAFIKINSNFTELFNQVDFSAQPTNNFVIDTTFIESNNYQNLNSDFTGLLGSTQEVINIGSLPNDGTGDPLRTAFSKINNNFANLFSTTTLPVTANTTGSSPNQVIFSTEIANFNQATFNIRSTDNSVDSQNIVLSAQINNDNTSVKFSAYATTFIGNAICTYDMDINASNVRILCNPLSSANLTHVIFSQLMQQI